MDRGMSKRLQAEVWRTRRRLAADASVVYTSTVKVVSVRVTGR